MVSGSLFRLADEAVTKCTIAKPTTLAGRRVTHLKGEMLLHTALTESLDLSEDGEGRMRKTIPEKTHQFNNADELL
jgi:hypothetical protein